MIFTSVNRIILDELPISIADTLECLLTNYTLLKKQDTNFQVPLGVEIYITKSSAQSDNSLWVSQKQCVFGCLIVSSQEIIEINDINNLSLVSQNQQEKYYQGISQSRIKMVEDNLIILYPEEAYRFHYMPTNPSIKCYFTIPVS